MIGMISHLGPQLGVANGITLYKQVGDQNYVFLAKEELNRHLRNLESGFRMAATRSILY